MAVDPVELERIERVQDLNLPPEADEVFEYLTEHGADVFSREIVQALLKAQARGDLRLVKDVVEAWYRTLLMRSHPDYQESIRWAANEDPGERFSADKLVAHYAE